MQREVERLLSILARREGTATDLSSLLGASVSNVICSVLMSVRFHPEDLKFQRFLHLMDEGFKLFTAAAKVNIFPFLRFLPGVSHAYQKLKEVRIPSLSRSPFRRRPRSVRRIADASPLERIRKVLLRVLAFVDFGRLPPRPAAFTLSVAMNSDLVVVEDRTNHKSPNEFLHFESLVKASLGLVSPVQNKDELDDFFMEIIDLHRQTFEAHNVRDLVDAYLLEFQQAREEGREQELFYGKNPGSCLLALVRRVFVVAERPDEAISKIPRFLYASNGNETVPISARRGSSMRERKTLRAGTFHAYLKR